MFAKLTGVIDTKMNDGLIMDVHGVGYLVYLSGRSLAAIGGVGDAASLLIETHVREDHIHLYGFATRDELQWFRLLLTVQGVGARSALAILSVCDAARLPMMVASGDVAAFRRADGVGPKLATRIVTELKDKVQSMILSAPVTPTAAEASLSSPSPSPASSPSSSLAATAPAKSAKGKASTQSIANESAGDTGDAAEVPQQNSGAIDQDVISALVNLGYGKSDAFSAVLSIRQTQDHISNFDELFKLSIKKLS
ncbi:MAG: Holliday junction branch migration protein RuvA [Alphaproteobacteria bacterium]|nr:Holliday junction branch migration protein RuvA [Alphaproteobacteria bacterium]